MKESTRIVKEATTPSESATPSPPVATSRRRNLVGDSSPPSGSPMILNRRYAFRKLYVLLNFWFWITFAGV